VITSLQLNELGAALVKFQGNMPHVVKGADNPFFKSKYADLASIMQAVAPMLAECGLAVTQLAEIDESERGNVNLTTMLLHASGQYIASTISMSPVKQDPQAYGSAITYARRYAVCSILGLAPDEDDDGNAASAPAAAPLAGANFIWPYGEKHKGKAISDINSEYLSWVIQQEKMPDEIKTRCKNELARRDV